MTENEEEAKTQSEYNPLFDFSSIESESNNKSKKNPRSERGIDLYTQKQSVLDGYSEIDREHELFKRENQEKFD